MNVYLLDMGLKEYGDCIVITHEDTRILIDCGKPSDKSSIKVQLRRILQQEPPFHFNLLVMTHCHDDHIGALPELIEMEEITADKYLLADPEFRWGREGEVDGIQADGFTDALLEEDHSHLDDAALEEFLSDIEALKIRYPRMIKTLRSRDADVRLFRGVDADDYSDLENEFRNVGLKILGPTAEQLQITKDALLGIRDSIADFLDKPGNIDSVSGTVELYRKFFSKAAQDNEAFLDAAKNKGGINDQSIVMTVTADGWKALLAADMQFAEPDVSGIDEEINALMEKVFEEGPYQLIKTCHHTSHNGLSESMLDRWISEGTEFFVHSGGLKDPDHPDADVLDMLKARKNDIKFARTDRNGLIKIGKNESDELTMSLTKGRTNNFTVNTDSDLAIKAGVPVAPGAPPKAPVGTAVKKGVEQQVITDSGGNVELLAKIPSYLSKVTITVEIESEKKKTLGDPVTTSFGSGRFDNLVFVTNSQALASNIGSAETANILKSIQALANTKLVDITDPGDVLSVAQRVRQEIAADTKGVVIIGGYDVIPSVQLNVISDDLRNQIESEREGDEEERESDDFIVWSDDIYGDLDNDFLPELPVSRIPDGKSSELVSNALRAPSTDVKSRYGIRNLNRPFAIDVFGEIPFSDGDQLEVSETCSPQTVLREKIGGALYFMLHGYYGDATRFAGEKENRSTFEAFDVYNVPKSCPGAVVFTGCCYGALIALPKADRKEPDITLRSRTPEQSIALAFLLGSANAFVGCTGAHYSPTRQEDNFFGKPMHVSFWANIKKGIQPAQALLNAKKEYAVNMPHPPLTRALSRAMEIKTLHQFTCLGLGW